MHFSLFAIALTLFYNVCLMMATDQVYIATMNPTVVSGPWIQYIPKIFKKLTGDPDIDKHSLYYMSPSNLPISLVVDLGRAVPFNTLGLSKYSLAEIDYHDHQGMSKFSRRPLSDLFIRFEVN